jgi:hypothetical protein
MEDRSKRTLMTVRLHKVRPDTELLLRAMLSDSLAVTAWKLEGETLTALLDSEEGEEHLARAFMAAGLHPLISEFHDAPDGGSMMC